MNERQLRQEIQRLKETVEVLAGERGTAAQYAVRRQDVARLGDLGTLQSKKVGAAPTMEEFNALVDDVQAIQHHLAAIAGATKSR